MSVLMQDLRLAFRSVRRQPGFTAVVVLTLALGIGVNVSVFQTAYGFVLRPLPFIDTGSEASGLLVALGMAHDTASVEAFDFSMPDVADFAEQCTVCRSVAVFDRQTVVLGSGGEGFGDGARRVAAQAVSPELFEVLDVEPLRGRTLAPGEDEPGAPRVAVLSHRLWQELGGADAFPGGELMIDGRPSEVVGVMPEGFHFPERSDLWFPLERRPEALRSQRWMDNVIARLEPGVGLERARAEAAAISRRLAEAHPESNLGWSFSVLPFRERLVGGDERRILALLAGAVGCVLLIACVNVTHLLLARESERRHASAIRMALGSDRLSLIRQRMTENLVLALAGGALGVLLSVWAIDYLAQADPEGTPAWLRLDLGVETLVFTVALTVVAALAFGLLPALRASGPDLGRTVGAGPRGTDGAEQQRLQQTLVVGQIALALTLLVAASLMAKSVGYLSRIDAGFDTANVLTLRTQIVGERYEDRALRLDLYNRLVERLEALPGVEAAAATSALPLVEDGTAIPFSYPGQVLRDGERQIASYVLQTPRLFDVLELPLLAGRRFTAAEAADPESRVVIVNEDLAELVWGRRDPIGERIRLGYDDDAPWSTVVGVVPKVYYEEPGEETDQSRFQIHLPYARVPWRVMGVILRIDVDPSSLVPTVRRELAAVDPAMAVDSVRTMETVRRQVIWGERLVGELFGSFAVLALVLSALGIYGVMAYSVARRRREIGVRMALGADRGGVARLFLGHGVVMVGAGVFLGLAGASAAGRLLAGILFEVEAGDPAAFGAALAVLLGAAAAGVALPARSAARVEPAIALRHE